MGELPESRVNDPIGALHDLYGAISGDAETPKMSTPGRYFRICDAISGNAETPKRALRDATFDGTVRFLGRQKGAEKSWSPSFESP